MPKLEEAPPTRTRLPEVPPARPQAEPLDEELSEKAVQAIEEGRADHAAGRTFTMAEVKRELGIES